MTALTVKQRAKVNAALCIIHDNGFSAQTLADTANAMIAAGQAPSTAYEAVLNAFAVENATLGHAVGTMVRLIDASNPATVAQYDQALSQYISSGDNSAMLALAPMIATDSVALAIRNGEMTQADVATGGLAQALGFEPGDLLQQAFDAAGANPSTPATDGLHAGEHAADVQISSVEGPGFVAAKAQAARVHYSGFARDTPAPNGLIPADAREAARSAAAGCGHAIIDAPVSAA